MAELWMIKIYAATRYRFENPAISPDLERASVAKKNDCTQIQRSDLHEADQEHYMWWFLKWSGREDSNFRPPVPKTGALPGCATPRLRPT